VLTIYFCRDFSEYRIRWKIPFRPPFQKNTLMPTKGAFLPRSLYTEFFKPKYEKMRRLIDKNLQCEDIMMASIHASLYNTPPMYVKVPTRMATNMACGGDLTKGEAAWKRRYTTTRAIWSFWGGNPFHATVTTKSYEVTTYTGPCVAPACRYQYWHLARWATKDGSLWVNKHIKEF
jgi:hypothetical protein